MDAEAELQTCIACEQPFVVPVALLDLIDEGLYLIALRCNNCDHVATGVFEDAELEALERANERAERQIEAALESVAGEPVVVPDDFRG